MVLLAEGDDDTYRLSESERKALYALWSEILARAWWVPVFRAHTTNHLCELLRRQLPLTAEILGVDYTADVEPECAMPGAIIRTGGDDGWEVTFGINRMHIPLDKPVQITGDRSAFERSLFCARLGLS